MNTRSNVSVTARQKLSSLKRHMPIAEPISAVVRADREVFKLTAEGRNKRKSGRVNVSFEARYMFGKTRSICLVTDLSMTGATIKVQQFFTEGDVLTLIFTIPDMGDFSFRSKVRHVRGARIGIEFLSHTTAELKVLTEFVKRETTRALLEFTKKHTTAAR